jgi:hypothetical protein
MSGISKAGAVAATAWAFGRETPLPCAPFVGRDAQGVPGEVGLFVPPEAAFPDMEATPGNAPRHAQP